MGKHLLMFMRKMMTSTSYSNHYREMKKWSIHLLRRMVWMNFVRHCCYQMSFWLIMKRKLVKTAKINTYRRITKAVVSLELMLQLVKNVLVVGSMVIKIKLDHHLEKVNFMIYGYVNDVSLLLINGKN